MRPVRSGIQRVSALKKFMDYRLSVISMLLGNSDGQIISFGKNFVQVNGSFMACKKRL